MGRGTMGPTNIGEAAGKGSHFNPRTTRRHWLSRLFRWAVMASTLVGVVFLAVLLVRISVQGIPRLSWDFITNLGSSNPEQAGVYAALLGSLWLIGLTTLLVVPFGIGAAIYLEEYAGDNWLNRIVEVNISNLAGVPSIVYGLLGLGIFVSYLGPLTNGQSILTGALTLSLLILPVIIIAAREAIRGVPGTVREGAYALGATRWEAVRDHVLPMALPGALTGTILALSRAVGETAPLIVVGAATYITFTPDGPFSRYSALPIQIYQWAGLPSPEFQVAAAAGIVVLMAVLLLSNSFAIALRNRCQKRG